MGAYQEWLKAQTRVWVPPEEPVFGPILAKSGRPLDDLEYRQALLARLRVLFSNAPHPKEIYIDLLRREEQDLLGHSDLSLWPDLLDRESDLYAVRLADARGGVKFPVKPKIDRKELARVKNQSLERWLASLADGRR